MAPLGPLMVMASVVFVLGGLFATLSKFGMSLEAIGALLLLSVLVAIIGLALRSVFAWFGFFPAMLFAGMGLFTAAFYA